MPPKLHYWPIRGRVHPIMMICVYAGVEFEFKGFDRDEWFGQAKPEMMKSVLNCSIPYVVDGDAKVCESLAVTQYMADAYKPELLGVTAGERATTAQLSIQIVE